MVKVLKKVLTIWKQRKLKHLTLDTRHVQKHLPGTGQAERLIQKEGAAHVFQDEVTMKRVAEAIKERGEYNGVVRGHERWGLQFNEPIGYRINRAGDRLPLYYGEMKIQGGKYHVIPRTCPS